MRWIRRLLLALTVLGAILLLSGVWLTRRPFPVVEGATEVAGLAHEVTIVRDGSGVPHITARTTSDLLMAQGYVHAQDRFWQMDTWRHIGAGRLAEMFGAGQVETDAFLRTLGFERAAAAAYDAASPEEREALEAYSAGVNAYLADRPGGSELSVEYAILGLQNRAYAPRPWEPIHTLTWAHVMAWDLRSNLEEELNRALVSGVVGAERTEDLYPPYPADHLTIVGLEAGADRRPTMDRPASMPALERVGANLAAVQRLLGRPREGIGSNNWVVAGSRSASGLPLLANDPHLGIQIPSIWYQATLWCEELTPACPYRVSGFTFPGAPGVVVGHNERIAWGVTNLGPDTMDLFIERVDGDRYEVDGRWVEFDVRTETIMVAGGEDVELEIRTTRHGPVISGRYEPLDNLEQGDGHSSDYEIALAWRALEPSTLFRALRGFNLASNWDEFREAASHFDIAAQNLVYADVDGHIGYQATGQIPIRRSGDGRYPVPGWTSDHEWEGFIPFEELPSVLDPPGGVIVTANQPLAGDDYPRFIGADHAYGFRAKRIGELVESIPDPDPAAMAAIQLDNYDASAAFVVPEVLELASGEPAVTAMQEVLGRWSEVSRPYQMDPDSPGAAAYAAVWRHLLLETFDELEGDLAPGGNGRYFEVMRRLLLRPEDPWWDNTSTAETETAPTIIERATIAAYEELVDRLGDDPAEWRWGDLHRASFRNQTLGQSGIGPIEALFNRTAPLQVGGGSAIVNATGWVTHEGYEVVSLPSMRMVVDLSDLSSSLTINTTGQSGHVFHPNYFDQVGDWSRGRMRQTPFFPEAIESGEILRLLPGQP